MKADTLKLTDIFRKDIRYVVPMFQRPYVWNEEEHWQLLWEDISQVVEELVLRRSQASPAQVDCQEPENSTPPLFLGAMVLDQLATPTSKLEAREVIDGQQRLTTLLILLAAIRSVASDVGAADQVALIEKLIYNDADLVKETDHLFKVWPIEPDQTAFRAVMNQGSAALEDGPGRGDTHPIVGCYQFFREAVADWLSEDAEQKQRLDALTSALWWLIRVVVIDLDPKDDPQVIFETLNARGTPLLAADLIKNLVFREAKKQDLPIQSLHEDFWRPFDNDYWREDVRQGRLERPRIDVFVMHWLTMRTAAFVRAQQLFPAFRNYLTRSESTIEGVLKDIAHYGEIYKNFSDLTAEGREGLFLQRLDAMDTTTPIPVLLWMRGETPISAQERTIAIEAIESWLVRRMLCRLTTKNYNRVFMELLVRLQAADRSGIGRTVAEFLKSKEGPSEYWPTDQEIRDAMVELPYWSRINRYRLMMVFRALERELRSTGFSESLDHSGRLHIEHILPQEWAHHWPLPGSAPEEVERLNREKAKHTIGNLTVLTEKLNPAISNSNWTRKRKAIDDHSVLLLNRELVRRYQERWDEETIVERALWLADLAIQVWPGPDSLG